MATKPKLMLFSHVCNTRSITGAEKLLLHFMREMASIFDCVLVVPQEGKLAGLARRFDIQVKVCFLPMLHGVYTPYRGIATDAEQLRHKPAYQDVVSLIRETGPDLVLTNTCVNVMPAVAAKSLQIPVIWKITEIIALNEHTNEAVQMIGRYSDWIIGISESAVAPFKQAGMSAKLTVISPTWDPALPDPERWVHLRERKRKELGFKPSQICIGYISSFIYDAKGLKPFVDMALQLCETHPRCRFWIIGTSADKKYYDECVSRVKKSGYYRRFTFTPFEENVSLAYTAMDMVVIPSMVKEGFGMTALEGLYFAKPVIAFAQGGLKELLESVGSGAFLAPAGDSQALATLATTLLNDPELASDTGWRNRTEAEKLYGIETYRAKLHTMVTQWLMRFPGWFPYIQPPNGPVYAWGEGSLRTVLILEPASVRARLFPLTVIQTLPISPLPPLAIGQPVHEETEPRSSHRTGRSRYPHSTHRSRVRNRMKRRGTGTGGRKLKASKKKKQRVRVGQPTVRKRTPGKTKRNRARRRLSNRR
ncbi:MULTISPECIES: glycosyltransferase family 4 protein [Paenibacillus]|uniref:Glycosyltransferase involved in cell wall biosynthesis n=1 Tax=Paenibacillus pabuli TaxID=1472 RepID=A0A855Y3I2_9BACL|nr:MULTISPECIES: glycosyltransferase family 4 protein [Paenibacillus]PWW35528.1 glycosyltransferase involved in cell wall biosynthesis [Paenibacillus pabuli]PXW02804.1 glycosyltransferase involved in cell wall biosynthesis [Paenibacillus taichungensis]RAI96754.1 glycosyltransferase involved in cell wall biosynthesis [Paenibacillus pabuli]